MILSCEHTVVPGPNGRSRARHLWCVPSGSEPKTGKELPLARRLANDADQGLDTWSLAVCFRRGKIFQPFGIAQMIAWQNGILNRRRPGYRSAYDYGRLDFLIHAQRLNDRLQPPAVLAAILVQTED